MIKYISIRNFNNNIFFLIFSNIGAFTLYGLTSWGQHCGRANKPGVYVRVSYYRQWIDKKIKISLEGK